MCVNGITKIEYDQVFAIKTNNIHYDITELNEGELKHGITGRLQVEPVRVMYTVKH